VLDEVHVVGLLDFQEGLGCGLAEGDALQKVLKAFDSRCGDEEVGVAARCVKAWVRRAGR
jgi:hypothetical protein